ncbi:MbnP family protein [Pontibacter beigongshangensis]|uniref:MbnP family protein n=1 Tax=Pontibacter beigongshangensis TaxID=2574733 RepID=UPI0016501869|nr:MbnP family protein [Pontibacter beigongshangensis]
MYRIRRSGFYVAMLAILFLAACKEEKEGPAATTSVTVSFQHVVGSEPLQLDEVIYTSPAGDSYAVSNFKYFVSNVKLISSAGEQIYVEPESYHLIAQDGKTSFELKEVPAGTYQRLELSLGIDEELNHRIDHLGDLDPSNEMVWDWDTGYKFLTLVGTYTGQTRSGGLVFHIGGDTNYRTLALELPQPLNPRQDGSSQVLLQANVNELFQGPNLIDFDVMNSSGHGSGPSLIAENYTSGFITVLEAK